MSLNEPLRQQISALVTQSQGVSFGRDQHVTRLLSATKRQQREWVKPYDL
jgi:hypothetical protein